MLSGSAGDQGSSSSKKLQAVSSMCSGITVSKYLKYLLTVIPEHGQQILKVFVWLQVVGLYCFCNTVDHSEGLCPVYSINDLPVLLFMCLRT